MRSGLPSGTSPPSVTAATTAPDRSATAGAGGRRFGPGREAYLAGVGPAGQLGGQHVERPDGGGGVHRPAGPVSHGDAPVLLRRQQASAAGQAQPDPHHPFEGGAHPGGRVGGRRHDHPAAVDVHRRRLGIEPEVTAGIPSRSPAPAPTAPQASPYRPALKAGPASTRSARASATAARAASRFPSGFGVEGVVAAHQRPHDLGLAFEQGGEGPPRTYRPVVHLQGGRPRLVLPRRSPRRTG